MDNRVNDFIVNSKGHCFFCLNRISQKLTSLKSEAEAELHVLQCVSQYLKMDMTKVFNQKGSIPPSLLAKVKQSRLKVELCEECASLTKNFSELFQQWEKLEMDMQTKLSHIQEKLKKSEDSERFVKLEGDKGTKEVLEVLRKEAMEKCTRKLGCPVPRVKIQKLTRKEVKTHRRAYNRASEPTIDAMPQPSSDAQMDIQRRDLIWNDDEDDGNTNDLNANGDDDYDSMPGLEVISDAELATTTSGDDSKVVRIANLWKSNNTATAAPGKNCSINSQTGKYKCKLCAKEFGKTGFYFHYRSVHLNVRYMCNLCDKTFSQKTSYNLHLRSFHLGVRFQCLVCNQQFKQKVHLQLHQKRKNSCTAQLRSSSPSS